jgi:phospholipid-translocating ATPase
LSTQGFCPSSTSTMANQPQFEEEPAPKSAPTKRTRWATQKVKGNQAGRKRVSIIDRLHRKGSQNEKKRESGGAESMGTDLDDVPEGSEDGTDAGQTGGSGPRKVYFNVALPSEALDENGLPHANFERNKIRTAKYTPLSFVPKNLWFQFHNIANIYFLFLIILSVSTVPPQMKTLRLIVRIDLPHIWSCEPRSRRYATHCHHLYYCR